MAWRMPSMASTLFNTYWLRFERGASTFDRAIANTGVLLEAARSAGVRRVVHISVVNASAGASTRYFRAKAALEADVRASACRGPSFAPR